ncbi:MAG: carboxylating nicotinate-nucleotide diphosphorylase [Candidatus Omnitrophica bacterium]|nr:carboxylating nicotinate-nucleotide diphosphorylase [Candidatus Omnitrophota bacterium]
MSYAKKSELIEMVKEALKEDIGARDITSELLIPPDKTVKAVILAKEDLVICGMEVAALVFRVMDKKIRFKAYLRDGATVKKGRIIASVSGKARSILGAERTALNFLCFLSGIATKTRKFAQVAKNYKVKILDTRKTIPGWRLLQKYAVRIGGGFNHRLTLEEMVMVKDNHIKVIGDRLWVLGFQGIKNKILPRIEIEVKTIEEFRKALALKPDIIMLDNMKPAEIKEAVKLRNILSPNPCRPTPKLEASGGITLDNLRKFAASGVDFISAGELTHSIDSVDISLEIIDGKV